MGIKAIYLNERIIFEGWIKDKRKKRLYKKIINLKSLQIPNSHIVG